MEGDTMLKNNRIVRFTLTDDNTRVCLSDLATSEVIDVLSVPEGMTDPEMITEFIALPAAAEEMNISCLRYRYIYLPVINGFDPDEGGSAA